MVLFTVRVGNGFFILVNPAAATHSHRGGSSSSEKGNRIRFGVGIWGVFGSDI